MPFESPKTLDDFKIHVGGPKGDRDCVMVSTANGLPPPGDRQYYQLGGRALLEDVERMLAWKGGEPGKRERLAFALIGQGISSLTMDAASDEEVRAVLDAWVAWAKASGKKG